MVDSSSRFQILSLDGGGIKGLFSAAVLAAVEEDLGINVVDHFDLIAGTSNGGIIALGLGLGMRPRRSSGSMYARGRKSSAIVLAGEMLCIGSFGNSRKDP